MTNFFIISNAASSLWSQVSVMNTQAETTQKSDKSNEKMLSAF
jgi:hypothetical protein